MRTDHAALVKATRWILDREIKIAGDWRVKNTTGPIGGWAFEFENAWYPDIDDTAMVLLALRRVKLEGPLSQAREKAFLRGLNWVLSMQSSNGGWAAFDIDNTEKTIFTYISVRRPQRDDLDPPTADVTARVLEALGLVGYDKSYPCVQRAIAFLKQRAGSRWILVWPLGCELHLRDLAGHPRSVVHRGESGRTLYPKCAVLAEERAAAGRWVGRALRHL